tara:strand:- start:31 stop:1251 length:1221 start_codon:yes stop_codon:yes gene_type:complete
MQRDKSKITETIRKKFEDISFCLNERSRRIWAATEAKNYGFGGTKIVHDATSIDYKTIRVGLKELKDSNRLESNRIRQKGGGRKNIDDKDPEIMKKLSNLVESNTRGDPESTLTWTSKSTYKLSEELINLGHKITKNTVTKLLKKLGYSLQSNRKKLEGNQHPDRNAQFEYINNKSKDFLHKNLPVISVDTKKKENIGEYGNNGKEYNEKGKPTEVNTYDFPDKKLGKVAPYGIYDIGNNKGWVNVGISSDTAKFAVNSIRTWWYKMGSKVYKDKVTDKIYINCDGGGSNGHRVRLWKIELQKLSNELNKIIHVSHFPPGTSKWNKIEHKMFSYISKNWRGRPLISVETIINLISSTTTKKGLEIKAMIDKNKYETGIKVSDKELAKISIVRDKFRGEWNYEIRPN